MTNEIFFDDFSNLSNWLNFGSPTPYTRGGLYFVNGDSWYASGSYSKQRFKIKDGLVLEFKACQGMGNVWDMFYHIGFGKNYQYNEKHIPYAITFGIFGHNPDKNMKYNNAVVCRVGSNQKILAGLNDGHSHTYKIEFKDGNVLFYMDDKLLYQCSNPYLGQELPLLISGRTYHKGSNWIDYIKIYEKEPPRTATTNMVKSSDSSDSSTSNLMIGIAIIAISLVVAGYYAYKKGYFRKTGQVAATQILD
jgi:hypothetical protein